jgi:multisubunit Na+/H+ antiporter MnhB subunit
MGSNTRREEPRLPDVTLTPVTATALFVVACLAGMRYRNIWKAEGPRSRLWLYGVIAAVALLVLGFVPMRG